MVHVIVGTGNASAAVMNALRLNVPMFFPRGERRSRKKGFAAAGTTLSSSASNLRSGQFAARVHRWDYELRNGDQVETVVDRALEMALGTPQGPVYFDVAARSAGAKDGLDHD